jgi:hypothetical protein
MGDPHDENIFCPAFQSPTDAQRQYQSNKWDARITSFHLNVPPRPSSITCANPSVTLDVCLLSDSSNPTGLFSNKPDQKQAAKCAKEILLYLELSHHSVFVSAFRTRAMPPEMAAVMLPITAGVVRVAATGFQNTAESYCFSESFRNIL